MFALLRVNEQVLAAASLIDPPTVRTLDAIHVASASTLRPALTAFVSYDARQIEAATAATLPVVTPS